MRITEENHSYDENAKIIVIWGYLISKYSNKINNKYLQAATINIKLNIFHGD